MKSPRPRSADLWRGISAGLVSIMLAGLTPLPAVGQAADPAATRIQSLCGALLDTMKQAKQLGLKGRYDKLAPALSETYDIASMTRLAVGMSWDTLQPAQQAALMDWSVYSDATVKLITGAISTMAADKSVGRAEAMRRSMLALIDKGAPVEAQAKAGTRLALVLAIKIPGREAISQL